MPDRSDALRPPNDVVQSELPPTINRKIAYRHGFKRGALWSLLIAIPFTAAMFVDTYRAVSTRENPDTGEAIEVALSVPEILIGCLIPASACAALFIVFPISFLWGIVAIWRGRSGTSSTGYNAD